MRIWILVLLSISLHAQGSTPATTTETTETSRPFFEKHLQKVGKKLDQAATEVKAQVHQVVEKAKDSEERKTAMTRVKSAWTELGHGFSRAWAKLRGRTAGEE